MKVRRIKLSERLPPGSNVLADFDERGLDVDYRPIAARWGRKNELHPRTQRVYNTWRDHYLNWARTQGYQPTFAAITDGTAREFTYWLTQPVPASEEDPGRPRYTPNSVQSALSAMRYWAIKTATHPMPSFDEANAVLKGYIKDLANPDQEGGPIIASRQDLRILPARQV